MRNIGRSGAGSGLLVVVVMVIVCLMLQDVRFVITLWWFLRGGLIQFFLSYFWSSWEFSIVPKLMRWIRLPWVPFGRDWLVQDLLFGILLIVFVVRLGCNVLPLEKSIGCESTTSTTLSWLPILHSSNWNSFYLQFGHHNLICLFWVEGFCIIWGWLGQFPLRLGCSHLWPNCESILQFVIFGGFLRHSYSAGFILL